MVSEISTTFVNSVTLSSFAFLILTWILIFSSARSLKVKDKSKYLKFAIFTLPVLLIWFSTIIFVGMTGFFSLNHLVVPYLFLGFVLLFGILYKLYNTEIVKRIAVNIPSHWIIVIQTYRIVGYGFIILYFQGLLPAAFAFSSGLGDMIVGFSAPIVAYLYYKRKPYAKSLAIFWNKIGILDLIIAISVGIIGFPLGLQKSVQMIPLSPSTELLSLYPLVIIPLFAVPLAIFLHLCLLRVLKNNKNI